MGERDQRMASPMSLDRFWLAAAIRGPVYILVALLLRAISKLPFWQVRSFQLRPHLVALLGVLLIVVPVGGAASLVLSNVLRQRVTLAESDGRAEAVRKTRRRATRVFFVLAEAALLGAFLLALTAGSVWPLGLVTVQHLCAVWAGRFETAEQLRMRHNSTGSDETNVVNSEDPSAAAR